ncbi:NUDIX hydrolase [Streptomyces europaeiscabiei]|uniref:NUDIX hydrolase n=1 Tax=Streptomyces europaeiscabiei TaxID=146819 RepID=UPI0029A0AC95|nr:NUDIX hydrolase [Streptomyces europaeiscabiei]MDX2528022.1 NUDIX hydrolase [Streptomyces europaeiscabiei]MDX2757858.1 NUDIX hydrolase [Streptomyces europaeiscabiei]
MDVVTWTGSSACALQQALRMTNDAFASHLGVGVRTVASWHSSPGIVPRTEIQSALDTAYERSPASVRRRFSLLVRPSPPAVEAQALRVAIAVVTRDDDVLLVCRRGSDALSWQFPAGVVKPGASPTVVAVEETHAETGVRCTVREQLGSRIHPATGVVAEYVACDYLMGEATNLDQIENADVAWVPRSSLTRFIPEQSIFPPVLEALA